MNLLKTSIGAIMKNQGTLSLVPDYFETKRRCKHAVKKLPFVIRFVPERYRI